MDQLGRQYFNNPDVVFLARDMLGKHIRTNIDGILCSAIIIETEAYRAPEDKASHAYGNKRTKRTETMFGPAGIAYVYLNYGIHHLFNIVTGPIDMPHAILIRAILPVENRSLQISRRKTRQKKKIKGLFTGPGKISQALGIRTSHNGADLCKINGSIGIFDCGNKYNEDMTTEAPRVGIDYAEEWALKPWRFILTIDDQDYQ